MIKVIVEHRPTSWHVAVVFSWWLLLDDYSTVFMMAVVASGCWFQWSAMHCREYHHQDTFHARIIGFYPQGKSRVEMLRSLAETQPWAKGKFLEPNSVQSCSMWLFRHSLTGYMYEEWGLWVHMVVAKCDESKAKSYHLTAELGRSRNITEGCGSILLESHTQHSSWAEVATIGIDRNCKSWLLWLCILVMMGSRMMLLDCTPSTLANGFFLKVVCSRSNSAQDTIK